MAGSRSGVGSVRQRHGSADPDPYQNVRDPQHCYQLHISPDAVQLRILLPLNFGRFATGFAAPLDGAAAQATGAGGAARRLGAGRRRGIIVLGAGGGGRRTLKEIHKLVALQN
jgi:hypothetical protein